MNVLLGVASRKSTLAIYPLILSETLSGLTLETSSLALVISSILQATRLIRKKTCHQTCKAQHRTNLRPAFKMSFADSMVPCLSFIRSLSLNASSLARWISSTAFCSICKRHSSSIPKATSLTLSKDLTLTTSCHPPRYAITTCSFIYQLIP